jgi:ABC-type transport system involved in multi-copper enzyme maturation permease subunit
MSAWVSAVHAEWTKLWTVRTVWWSLLAAAVLMVAGAGQNAIYVNGGDYLAERGLVQAGPGTVAVLSVELVQFAVLALAMLSMTGEYSNRTITATLSWVPSRGRLMAAKAAVVLAVTAAAGILLGVVGVVMGALVLDDPGGATAAVAGDVLAIGAYLAAVSVLTLGLGAALRGPVVTLIAVFLLLTVVPPLLRLGDIAVLDTVADALPGAAGMHFLRGGTDPYPPAVGLLIMAAWAGAALLLGWRVLRRRDA